MLLLPARDLTELLLRDPLDEPLQPSKHLVHVLFVGDLELRPADQLLDPQQAGPAQMLAQPLVDLAEHELVELCVVALLHVEDGVDEPRLDELVGGDATAHDEGLVGAGGAEALDEGAGGAALCDEAEGGEGGEEEGVGCGVDEVGEGDDGGGEADDGAIEADDEDFWVGAEGVGDVEVEGDEVLEPVLVDVHVAG